MLRRQIVRFNNKSAATAAASSASAGGAAGLGDKPVFRVSSFFRPVDASPASSEQIATEAKRVGKDAAAASTIDFIELQWMLLPYRFRKLVLEVQEVRRVGVMQSLSSCPKQNFFNLLLLVVAYSLMLRVGRGSIWELKYPKSQEEEPAKKKEEVSATAAAAAASGDEK